VEKGFCLGNSGDMKLVRFAGDLSLVGSMADVHITGADTWILSGSVV